MVSRWKLSVLVCVGALLPVGLAADEVPPQDLHVVGDHWTAWNPPTSFPEGTEVYTIKRGDTLWDLSGRFYDDPYLWPQLWEQNRYILDAHWIYPGDPLAITIQATPVQELAQQQEEAAQESPFLPAGGELAALGSPSDIYCSGYIGAPDKVFGYRIVGSEFGSLAPELGERGWGVGADFGFGTADTLKVGLTTPDLVYLDGGSQGGLAPGMVFTAVKPGELVYHPQSGELIGRYYSYRGRVRVLSVQLDTAIAEIVHSCSPISVGAVLQPFVEEPIPLARRTLMRPAAAPEPAASLVDNPVILRSEKDVVSMGQGHLVYIDQGSGATAPGEIYTVYRMNREEGLPPVVLGELAVLSSHDRASLARILESRYVIHVGDVLSLK